MKLEIVNILNLLYSKLDSIYDSGVLDNKEVYIWGMQRASHMASQYLIEKGVNVISLLDNNENYHGKIHHRIINSAKIIKELFVLSPEILKEKDTDNCIILVFSRAYESICKQAAGYGVKKDSIIYVYSSEENMFAEEMEGHTEIFIDERKMLQFEILKHFKSVCEKHGLKYYLVYGTLLGAVRHKGYIPWDDDIDVGMPYADFLKLRSIYKDNQEDENVYSLEYFGLSGNFGFMFAKMRDKRTISRYKKFPLVYSMGLTIDIFPICGMPSEEKAIEEYKKHYNEVNKMYVEYLTTLGTAGERNFDIEAMDAFFASYDYDTSEYLCSASIGDWQQGIYHSEDFKDTVELSFEGELFKAPSGYDRVLRDAYGDYMEFPPEWERPIHSCKAYWR